MEKPFRRVRIGLAAFGFVLVGGTVGYLILGYSLLDAVFQTVETVSTVGFGTLRRLDTAGKVFTIVLILVGVGTALYSFTAALEVLIEGHMRELVRRRRMERDIAAMSGHVIICGWGRVGQAVARFLATAGQDIVVVDRSAERLNQIGYPTVHGDLADDETLIAAGIDRAATLVAALDTDADNLYVTFATKSMRPDLQIIARARQESSEPKLLRAGADRVVNPQKLGGDRMAAFVTQPHVVDFVDVVMHDGTLEVRLEEFPVSDSSPLQGKSLTSAQLRDRTGALVLAIRREGSFVTNPSPDLVFQAGDVLIGVGTAEQLSDLARFATES
jgi:voltage-gated potassium channel